MEEALPHIFTGVAFRGVTQLRTNSSGTESVGSGSLVSQNCSKAEISIVSNIGSSVFSIGVTSCKKMKFEFRIMRMPLRLF